MQPLSSHHHMANNTNIMIEVSLKRFLMLKSLSYMFTGTALGVPTVPAQFKHFLVWMIHEHPHQSCKTPCNLSKVNTDKNCVSPPLESGQPHGSWVWAGHWVGPEYSQILTQFLHILPSPAGSPECSEWYRGVSVNHVSNSNMFWQLYLSCIFDSWPNKL